ncbi:DUF6377 domain-containing protein [Pararcticibacter amylolyticus]|uniref:DUF6377 domain-containing protein n=1 Tax=Pararcticibacter amylolyticus TaxID=2173175 RepID=A0A2U2P995_9SPHI|nr:DUF6377 domain-containing protein [Pararcticibacter amylolyticus]PWG77968.1 hypothetical protein DDR33_24720 [Pararcticibacter amylolyticus]
MTKIKLSAVCMLFLISAMGKQAFCSSSKDSLLSLLRIELKNKDYDRQKEAKIQALRVTLNHPSNRGYLQMYALYGKMLDEYKSYQFDSSYAYVKKMIDLSQQNGDTYRVQESKLKLLKVLTLSGMFKEAYELVMEFDKDTIAGKLKATYYDSKSRFYGALAKYNNDRYYAKKYWVEADKQFENMVSVAPLNDFEKTINLASSTGESASLKPSAKFYLHFITHRGLSNHDIAMVAMKLSHNYAGGDRIALLALSAISDIRSSTKETEAILKLGEELYKSGDLKMAYVCLNKAISDAEFYSSRSHKIDIQNVLPLIAGKTILETERQRDKSIIYTLIFAVIVVVAVCILFVVFIQLRKIKVNERLINEQKDQLQSSNLKLMEHTRINEEYIGFFFKKSFSYISMLENLKRRVERRIKMKKVDDALEIMSDVQIEREREDLYHTLDQIFLKLLPNFIPAFNELLKPEDQIWPQKEESLNTVLRIFALIRLGIKDDETIAGILDYSVSTIYTYKIRIKAKAIVKGEEFDKRIMNIKFINS